MQNRTARIGTLVFSVLFLSMMLYLAFYHRTVQYLIKMGASQAGILFNAVPVHDFVETVDEDSTILRNLSRIVEIKNFSVEELGFKPTEHYSTIFPDQGKTLLWVLSASDAFEIKAYLWSFPLLGNLSYKGFFNKKDAEQEMSRLHSLGYDVEMAAVSAWSSLGWWPEPLLEKHLHKNKADFCALLFHELFHSTYYKAGDVNLNENLADFIAEKACLLYLKQDQNALGQFLEKQHSSRLTAEFMLNQARNLNLFYDSIRQQPNKVALKKARFESLARKVGELSYLNHLQKNNLRKELFLHKNAAFVAYQQYRGLYDSLEFVFNNFYAGQIKKMVGSLKQD